MPLYKLHTSYAGWKELEVAEKRLVKSEKNSSIHPKKHESSNQVELESSVTNEDIFRVLLNEIVCIQNYQRIKSIQCFVIIRISCMCVQ